MHTVEITQIRILAAKEFRDRIRNRWVIAVAIIFTLFVLAISYFGSAQQGSVGPGRIEVTIASLVSLSARLLTSSGARDSPSVRPTTHLRSPGGRSP